MVTLNLARLFLVFQPATFNNLNHEEVYRWVQRLLPLLSLLPPSLLGPSASPNLHSILRGSHTWQLSYSNALAIAATAAVMVLTDIVIRIKLCRVTKIIRLGINCTNSNKVNNNNIATDNNPVTTNNNNTTVPALVPPPPAASTYSVSTGTSLGAGRLANPIKNINLILGLGVLGATLLHQVHNHLTHNNQIPNNFYQSLLARSMLTKKYICKKIVAEIIDWS